MFKKTQHSKSSYGLSGIKDESSIYLGSPIRVYLFDDSFYSNDSMMLKGGIRQAGECKVPIIFNDSIRAFLIVGKIRNEWKVVGIIGFKSIVTFIQPS